MSQPKTLTQSPLAESAEAAAAAPKPCPPVPTASWEAVRKLREQNPMVDYRPYPLAPHYIVGDDGSVWSTQYTRSNKIFNRSQPIHLSPRKGKGKGREYSMVSIYSQQVQKMKKVSVLVLETFISLRPAGKLAAHNNGDSFDDRIGNLRWATPQENMDDMIAHGHSLVGEKQRGAKLNDDKVIKIRRQREQGLTYKEISKQYGVSEDTIGRVVKFLTWRHVPITQ